jgi:hypothetical protein
MSLIEVLTLSLGAAVAKTAAKVWLKESPFIEGMATSLVDPLKQKIEDFETRRSTERLFPIYKTRWPNDSNHLLQLNLRE